MRFGFPEARTTFEEVEEKEPSKVFHHPHRDANEAPVVTKTSRIVIIGGGPAGVHMGHLLKAKGFTDVKILEKDDHAGGKSRTLFHPDLPDVPHEMGTCFLHPGYHRVQKLLKKYDLDMHKTGGEKYGQYTIYSPELNAKKGKDEEKTQNVAQWIFADVEKLVLPKFLWFLPDVLQVLTIEHAVKKYCHLHREIFGKYEYPLPPRLSPAALKKIDMTFEKFIKLHDLEALIPFFLLGTSAQAYGYLETLPAFYGLWWNVPDFAQSLVNPNPLACVVTKGFQNLWETIAKVDQLDITFGAEVVSIDRSLDKRDLPIQVKYKVGEAAQQLEADFVIFTAPLKAGIDLFVDAQPEEKDIFHRLRSSRVSTTLYRSQVTDVEEQATTFFPERLGPEFSGKLYAERNSSRAVFPDRNHSKEPRLAVAYQYYHEDAPQGTPHPIKEELEIYHHGTEVIQQFDWDYFPRFSQSDINDGYPWKILDLQGKFRTWYAGSSVCFESVEDVVGYNHLLLKVFNFEEIKEII